MLTPWMNRVLGEKKKQDDCQAGACEDHKNERHRGKKMTRTAGKSWMSAFS